MIRISHVTLPPGLSALAHRGPDGELTVFVSDALPADRQRAAVRTALRAARRPDWRAALPAPSAAILLAFAAGWFRRAAGAVRAHLVTFATASAVVAAAGAVAAYLAVAPHTGGPVSLPRATAPGTSRPAAPSPPVTSPPVTSPPARHPRPRPHHTPPPRAASTPPVAPMATGPGQPVPSAAPSPSPSPSPSPVPSSTSPSPVPPSPPAPSPPGRGQCLHLLSIRVCIGISL